MIKAGQMVCFKGLHVVENPYYCVRFNEGTAVLATAKNRLGAYKIYDVNKDVSKRVEVELEEKPETINGLLSKAKIRVTFPDGISYSCIIGPKNRICPTCYDTKGLTNILPKSMGFEDTYIVGVVGSIGVGKSSWMDSACLEFTMDEQSRMNLTNKCVCKSGKYDATAMNSNGSDLVRQVIISDKKGRRNVGLFFNDTPGEYTAWGDKEINENYLYFERYMELCDGIVYVVKKEDDHIEEVNFMSFIPERMPVAVVMSKIDELKKETEKAGGVYCYNGRKVLTDAYFKRRVQKANLSQMDENQVVDKGIIRWLCPSLSSINRNKKNVGYFAVSAGVPNGGENSLDLTKSMNAFAPLLFLLKYFGIR